MNISMEVDYVVLNNGSTKSLRSDVEVDGGFNETTLMTLLKSFFKTHGILPITTIKILADDVEVSGKKISKALNKLDSKTKVCVYEVVNKVSKARATIMTGTSDHSLSETSIRLSLEPLEVTVDFLEEYNVWFVKHATIEEMFKGMIKIPKASPSKVGSILASVSNKVSTDFRKRD